MTKRRSSPLSTFQRRICVTDASAGCLSLIRSGPTRIVTWPVGDGPFHAAREMFTTTDPGRLPGFAGCKHLLLHPRLSPEGFDTVDDPEGVVKVLMAIPITPHERHLILEHGRDALINYLAENEIDVLTDRA